MSPERRRRCVIYVCQRLGVSERRACHVLDQPRSSQHHELRVAHDEEALTVLPSSDLLVCTVVMATAGSPPCFRLKAGG